MNASQREKLVSDVLHLSIACPHDYTNPPFCPLQKVREMTVEERIQWCRSLTAEDMKYIATYHQICLQCRSSGVLD